MKIISFMIPGWHPGYLGCYGNDWVDTHNLDELAAQSVVFDQHYADGLQNCRSYRTGCVNYSWLANEAPVQFDLFAMLQNNGVEVALVPEPSAIEADDFQERLRQIQSEVLAVVEPVFANDRALIHVELPPLHPPWSIPEEILDYYFQEEDGEDEYPAETNQPLLDPPAEIDARDGQQLARLQFTYAALIHFVDMFFEGVISSLQEQNLLSDTAIVLTSDRGVALGEHGAVGGGGNLHQELVHLPLLIRLPQAQQAGRRIGAMTQPVDLFATLLKFFEIAAPPCHSRSLFPLIHGQTAHHRDCVCAGQKIGNKETWTLRTPEWALIHTVDGSAPQLFVKPDDRWEVNDVCQQHSEEAEKLEQLLKAYIAFLGEKETTASPPLCDNVTKQ